MRKLNSRRYYTTPLAIRLLSCAAHAEAGPSQRGFLVLETNFRLYSYTDSPLWVQVRSTRARQYSKQAGGQRQAACRACCVPRDAFLPASTYRRREAFPLAFCHRLSRRVYVDHVLHAKSVAMAG